ncbi:translation elongation factor Ts [Patescibacteria group bacterium]|nr:translation elongation factor Ts [Patescibacteria group bacterium]MBU4512427.1 translation elongation factor Ts [Patescibacteria group bacterium]MCG2692721.1 translation elongation factor Ts [Candidatus Parcubacteria bacterium]
MSVDLNLVKQLRQQTGVGMMECKEALEETSGDLDKALEVLRKKGAVKAAKKADREAKEGLIEVAAADDHKKVALVQVQCETDFVAKNEVFSGFVKELAAKAFEGNDAEQEFEKQKDELVLKIGENLIFSKAELIEGEYVSSYLHANHKLAGVAAFNKELPDELAHDIAMQVAASGPLYVKPEDVPKEVQEKEKEIYREQLKGEGKPAEIVEKILLGKINKYYEEVCLLKQPFVKEDKKRVEQLLPEGVEIIGFVRYSL